MTETLRERLGQAMAEGFHSAFRKGSDHPKANVIWREIDALPDKEWTNVIEFVLDGIEVCCPDIFFAESALSAAREEAARAERERWKEVETWAGQLEDRLRAAGDFDYPFHPHLRAAAIRKGDDSE